VAMIPVVYSVSQGHVSQIPFDARHRGEILLTILQSLLGIVLLLDMKYTWLEAAALFVLWFVQFVVPSSREVLLWVYGGLILAGLAQVLFGKRRLAAFQAFAHEWQRHSKAAC
jgi:cation:H+ antiporter